MYRARGTPGPGAACIATSDQAYAFRAWPDSSAWTSTGHTTLAEWTAGDPASVEAAVAAFRESSTQGYYAIVTGGEGHAEQVASCRSTPGS